MWKADLVTEILAQAKTENLFVVAYNQDTERELSIEAIEVVKGNLVIVVSDN